MLKNNASERDSMQMEYTQMSQSTYGGCGCNKAMDMNPCPMPSCPPSQTCCCPPITECPQNQVCHRVINYEVPHLMPMNTTVVNHHIYKHTYSPCYTCCEENEVCNVNEGCSCNF